MRQHARRATQIPLRYYGYGMPDHEMGQLRNVSLSGLSFKSRYSFQAGSKLLVNIPLTNPTFMANGFVVWCHHSDSFYEIGIKFQEMNEEPQKNMFEQVCLIEKYRTDIKNSEGRDISSEQAAEEWLSQFKKAPSC